MKKLLLIFLIFILNSCQTPLGGAKDVKNIEPEERPNIESIEAGLWMQMDNYEDKLKTSGSRLKDKNLDKYLKDILCNLTEYCQDIRVYVQDIPYFNAFMAPNGMMVVWTGLLLRVGNEAQLAAVIGHEAGHYIRRHSLKAWLDAKTRTDLMAILSIGLAVGGVPGGGDIFNISQLLQAGIMAKHSRDNEREADEIGLDSLIKAGYDPDEAPKIWENILKEMELGENKNPPAFFASHPNPKERIKNLKEQTKKYSDIKRNHNKENLKNIISPHTKNWIKNEIRTNSKIEQTSFIFSNFFDNKEDSHLLKFYQGEIYRLKKEEKNNEKAIELYKESIEENDNFPDVYRELGLLLLKEEKKDEARKNLEKYVTLAPNAKDVEIVKSYIK